MKGPNSELVTICLEKLIERCTDGKKILLVCLFVKIKNHKILTVPYKFQVRKKGNPSLSEAVRIRDTWVHSILTTFFPSPNEEPSQQDIWSPLPPHMQPRYGF